MNNKIETFGLDIEELDVLTNLEHIAYNQNIERIVALPDVHQKKHLEAPTSIVVATHGTIVPELTTPTLGCSIGTIVTDLNESDLSEQFLQNFFSHIKDHLTFSPPSKIRTLLIWLGLISPKIDEQGSYDFSRREVEEVASTGASAVLGKYGFEKDILNHIENPGRKLSSLRGLIPRSGYQFSRSNIGYGFHGNHFLEIQVVDEIVDEKVAKDFGLRKGQVLVSYHGGEGALAFFIGRYFSNHRIKFSLKEELMRLPAKLLFHLPFYKSLRYYFGNDRLVIPANSHDGRRYLDAVQAGANYGIASRLAMIRRIIDALDKSGSDIKESEARKSGERLLWDASHTTITQENIEGKNLVVHRNGAVKVVPGKPVLVCGSDKTRSCIAIGLPNTDKYLNSADHGSGETIKKFTHLGRASENGLDYVVKTLERANIIKPVAYLRPVATFRD
ncbi:MAG TPA: RtcB family protein [Candidatus Paceibacterota bacterium]